MGELKPGAVEEVRRKILRDQLGQTYDAALEALGQNPEKTGKPGTKQVTRSRPGKRKPAGKPTQKKRQNGI